ncbi:uncharacterized protein LOC111781594 [Cucurbita pepo subsp. pepo]|uniref:uncharacterized protein LOC111781594 n=1 Tax=Cucurbita pepo subsp. pepo TaxID=3664 RepID=UPI000C9D2DB0|nr:uncharacterized protein LOC111781594 [Cucurbita pepo subsp. pepo]
MSFITSRPIQYRIYGYTSAASGEQPYQVLQLQLHYIRRDISVSPLSGVTYLQETAPILLRNLLFPLPLQELHDPVILQVYVAQLLSLLNVRSPACEAIAERIVSYTILMAGGNRETSFHTVVDLDFIRLITWMEENHGLFQGWSNGSAEGEETVILEEARPVTEKVEENGEEMGDCSICLEELNGNGNGEGKKREEVIRMQCGHVYHESCIFNWLHHNSSCPLCRAPL